MPSQITDLAALNTVLAIGGEVLRAQLLEDLQQSETEIASLCAALASGAPVVRGKLRHALHEMRNIALIVGAGPLAKSSGLSETACMTGDLARMRPALDKILTGSRALRVQIDQHSGTPA